MFIGLVCNFDFYFFVMGMFGNVRGVCIERVENGFEDV